jgi:chromate reductase, NAD(P)H dehydrogenase (quinone)
MKLLVFAGSTRAASHNRKLAQAAASMADFRNAEVTVLELSDFDIPLYNADLEAQGTPPDVIRLKALMHEHPGWIICSPEYNGGMTALLKNTLDWASSPVKGHPEWGGSGIKPFAGKVVGLLSASPGALGGLRSLGQLAPILRNLQCWVAPRQFALPHADKAFSPYGTLLSETAHDAVQGVVDQVLLAAGRLSPPA